jgi:hypothetical protein
MHFENLILKAALVPMPVGVIVDIQARNLDRKTIYTHAKIIFNENSTKNPEHSSP